MNSTEIMKALANPFPASDIEWRLSHNNEKSGLAVPYIDSRAIQKRLDEVFGAFNWQNTFALWHNNAQLCGISVYNEERREWITKYDGAANTDIEPVKGGLSDSLKRAAVHWGIGRYLYGLEGVWVDVEKKVSGKGKTSYFIKKDQHKKLDNAYNNALAQLMKGERIVPTAPPPDAPSQTPQLKTPVTPESTDNTPNNPPIGANDNVTPFPGLYTVTSAKPSANASGASTTLQLTDSHGKSITAYLRGENPQITTGIKLASVKLTEKKGSYGPYYIVDMFEIAA